MTAHRLKALHDAGTSIWLDYIDRTMLGNGDLERRIRDDALSGMTSNPTIFEKALGGTAYDAQIAAVSPDLSTRDVFERLATDDVRRACDAFRAVYDATDAADGYVSLEVGPDLAHDAEGTVTEARRLWSVLDRPNAMIKVPGTPEGCVAIRQLIAVGINVNVTLLFSVEAHAAVIEAYLGGLEARAAAGRPIDRIASVASFFVSRVDTESDTRLDATAAAAPAEAARLEQFKGRAAIANARLAYALFRREFSGPRWAPLAAKGARVQRPLWASTSVKNPEYRDVMYVEQLTGPDTVNTMPPATVDAYRDHGVARVTLGPDAGDAEAVLAALGREGIAIADVTAQLLREGIASFRGSFDSLRQGLEAKLAGAGRRPVGA
ncbi:MAG: transaldolase [Gemmatimonadota bacterium]